ncbi:MMPL family transporter [Sporichthya polymorpha]|uniref:MMPL family transporter n=1 Tax=Sporichthya polymorpha TaxID=35751 RepID=UPI000367B45B|nr:MMPL family transporter [Sporichthya polymorpha]
MALLLYRLGRWCFRRRRWVAALWLVALLGGGVAAGTLAGETSDEFTIPGTESQKAIDLLAEKFPSSGVDGATARVVFTAPDGDDLRSDSRREAIGRVVEELRSAPQVGVVVDPFEADAISPDGRTAYAQVQYLVQSMELTEQAREALTEAAEPARTAGVGVAFGGDASEAEQEESLAEVVGIVIAGFVLVLTLGSLVASGLPLLNAIVSVALSMMAITTATGFVELSSSASSLALMLGLAVSIDYALFILSRYRFELTAGRDPEEAVGRAAGTAGSAVVFAGLTVVIALAALSVVNIPFLTAMGLGAAATVVVAVVVALTLLPAMLGFAGERVKAGRLPGKLRRLGVPRADRPTLGARWVGLTLRHRVVAVVASVVGLLVLALPLLDLRLGMPGDDTRATDTTQRQAYDQLAAGFGPGFNGPLMVAVEPRPGTDLTIAANTVRDRLGELEGVVAVTGPNLNDAADAAIVTVVPATGPTAAETTDLVNRIRGATGDAISDEANVELAVTGSTAILIDVSDKLDAALAPFLLVVGGLAFVLLLLVFRSILVPIKAVLGFLLSVAATFGAVVAIFQWGWFDAIGIGGEGPVISFLPIFMIGLVFGLAMDYEVFLVTRMREEFVHGAEPTQAVAVGFEQGARVVTAAAVIMMSVFFGFMLAPDPILQSFGFALGFGVLVDAFVVRMTLVPAVLSLLGRSAWWIPRWLDRALPDVDVEGERLREQLDGHAPVGMVPVSDWPVVYGTVRSSDGTALPGAIVTLTDLRGRQIGAGQVGADGTYLCRLEAGADGSTVVVITSAPGHRTGVSEARDVLGPTRRHAVLAREVVGGLNGSANGANGSGANGSGANGQGAAAGGVGTGGAWAGQLPR